MRDVIVKAEISEAHRTAAQTDVWVEVNTSVSAVAVHKDAADNNPNTERTEPQPTREQNVSSDLCDAALYMCTCYIRMLIRIDRSWEVLVYLAFCAGTKVFTSIPITQSADREPDGPTRRLTADLTAGWLDRWWSGCKKAPCSHRSGDTSSENFAHHHRWHS